MLARSSAEGQPVGTGCRKQGGPCLGQLQELVTSPHTPYPGKILLKPALAPGPGSPQTPCLLTIFLGGPGGASHPIADLRSQPRKKKKVLSPRGWEKALLFLSLEAQSFCPFRKRVAWRLKAAPAVRRGVFKTWVALENCQTLGKLRHCTEGDPQM